MAGSPGKVWHDVTFYESLLSDIEVGNFENVRERVENVVGVVWRGVLPLGEGFTQGDYIPVRSARAPIKALRHKLPPGCYVLYGRHPTSRPPTAPDHEAAVGALEPCKWKTASGNQNKDVGGGITMTKYYYDAGEEHLFAGGYHVRGTIFSRTEDEAAKVWTAGRSLASIVIVSPRGGRVAKETPREVADA